MVCNFFAYKKGDVHRPSGDSQVCRPCRPSPLWRGGHGTCGMRYGRAACRISAPRQCAWPAWTKDAPMTSGPCVSKEKPPHFMYLRIRKTLCEEYMKCDCFSFGMHGATVYGGGGREVTRYVCMEMNLLFTNRPLLSEEKMHLQAMESTFFKKIPWYEDAFFLHLTKDD